MQMTRESTELFGLPRGAALGLNFLLASAFAAYFWTVYWIGDSVAANSVERFHVAFAFERTIPFFPWAALIYLTVTPFLCIALFMFRTPVSLLPLFATLCTEVTIAGVIFCLFPVELSFPPQDVTGVASIPLRLARQIALTYNCVPSLHVALALTAAWAYAAAGALRWRIFVWSWAAAIALSTLFTHQHHLLDLAAGALLSSFAALYVPRRVEEWLQARSRDAAPHDSPAAHEA
jgi:membrane-associated phospholipid phosphatase